VNLVTEKKPGWVGAQARLETFDLTDSEANRSRSQEQIEAETVSCPACGWPARIRGRRLRLVIYECIDDRCAVTIFEVHDPAPALSQGGSV
jgi:hypothetical protein